MDRQSFASRLLAWFDTHGRHGLPWQQPRTAYRVWLSEVMLQQTQVAAVIPYFQRFVARFPDVASLAAAEADEVMRHWAGLGYYARARNLHACAKAVVADHGGSFPTTAAAVEALPGIGRSTAAAIVSQAFGEPQAILDGNVKRVLARWGGIEGYPGEPKVAAKLWQLAESLLPATRAADYTQAQMDLGATLCTARNPACQRCPVSADCVAYAEGRTAALPARKPRRERPRREAWLMIAEDDHGRVLFEQRPGAGIWGGLWCPPVLDVTEDRDANFAARTGFVLREAREEAPILHGFTHYELTLRPWRGRAEPVADGIREGAPITWHPPSTAEQALPLPAPVAAYFALAQRTLALP